MTELLTIGSLFAGIGGFDLAAERVGMTVEWQSENDPRASAVLDHHWPHVKNLGDIHGITDAARVDVLTGGFPCQDYSVAGTRGGLAGDRGALWWEYHRLIDDLRPTWVVGENVPGLLSSRDGADFETIVGSLTECGYGVAWAVLDAQYFGVAQRRRRVFIVGHSGGEPRPEILALGEGLFGHPEPRREAGQGLTPDVAGSIDAGEWRGPNRNQIGTVVGFAQNQRDEVRDLKDQAGALAAEPGIKQQTYVLQEVGARESKNQNGVGIGLTDEDLMYTLQAGQQHGVATSVAVRGRSDGQEWELGEPGVANALRAGDGGSSRANWMTDSMQVRRLTPLECERLQGFPDGWTDIPGNSDTQRYRQLGNAVAVPVAEWILGRIKEFS